MENQVKVMTSADIGKLYREVNAFITKKDTSVSPQSIADRMIDAYKYAAVIRIRDGYENEAEVEADRKLILDDLEDRPEYVRNALDTLEEEYIEYERMTEMEQIRASEYAS